MNGCSRRSSNTWKRRLPSFTGPLIVFAFCSCLNTAPVLKVPAARPVSDWRVKPKEGMMKASAWWETAWLVPTGCDKFLNLLASTQWRRFVTTGRELLSGPLVYEKMAAKVDAWAWLIAPVLKNDFSINYSNWLKDYLHFRDYTLRKTITDFTEYLEKDYVE